jgi:hypothetical protein
MINKDILINRLTYIKQLYKIGLGQASQHDNIAVFSILSFHDSIEMFLKLLSEHNDINASNFNFLDYWEKIPSLTLKESMRNFNLRRVNIKHKGLLPAKSEIEVSRVNVTDFFNQNTKIHFGIEFSEISLIELISYLKVKEYLKLSQDSLDNNKAEDCIENAAYAFDELLHTYESNKTHWGTSPFFFGKSTTFLSSFSLGISRHDKNLGKLSGFIDTVTESIEALQKAAKITSFGIDYKEYVKFKILTPIIHRFIGGDKKNAQIMGSKKWTRENCQFCIDFVIDSALRLQQFDFTVESLEDSRISSQPFYEE